MAWHIDTIKDVSKRPWWTGSAEEYRAEVKVLAARILEWHGAHEETRFTSTRRLDAAVALGYDADHAQLAGDAYFHLRDQGYASVERTGRSATEWSWSLTSKGIDATKKLYLEG